MRILSSNSLHSSCLSLPRVRITGASRCDWLKHTYNFTHARLTSHYITISLYIPQFYGNKLFSVLECNVMSVPLQVARSLPFETDWSSEHNDRLHFVSSSPYCSLCVGPMPSGFGSSGQTVHSFVGLPSVHHLQRRAQPLRWQLRETQSAGLTSKCSKSVLSWPSHAGVGGAAAGGRTAERSRCVA